MQIDMSVRTKLDILVQQVASQYYLINEQLLR